MSFLAQTVGLFCTVILPVLLIVAAGAYLQRFHRLDMQTMSRLQIHVLVPIFLFYYIYTSNLTLREFGQIAAGVLLAKLILLAPLWLLLRRSSAPRETQAVALLSSVIFNAGNFGIPVALRAFGERGAAVQAVIVMVSNLCLWGAGYAAMSAITGRGLRSAIVGYFKLPMVYMLVIAFTLRGLHIHLPEPVLYSAHLLADGLVPVALMTLGAQLALQARWPRWNAVVPVLIFKLLLLPLSALLAVCLLGLWPWPGAVIVLAASGPSAVNTLLLAIDQKGDVELAAECVFWTTLLSAITVTVVLVLIRQYSGLAVGV